MSDYDLKQIGRRIYERRRQLDLTQEQLAERMNVSVQMISNLERGNKAIRIENLIKLCEILCVSTDHILLGSGASQDAEELSGKISGLPPRDRELISVIVDYCVVKDRSIKEM